MKLWKTEIVIWTEYDPQDYEIDDLAREAMTGDAYCSRQEMTCVQDPWADQYAPSQEFFAMGWDDADNL